MSLESHEANLEKLSAKFAEAIPHSSIRAKNLKDIVLGCAYNEEIGIELLNVIKEGIQIITDHAEEMKVRGGMKVREMSYLMKIELLYQHLGEMRNMPPGELTDSDSEGLISQLLEKLN